jgi:hypothetical protein
MKKIIDGVVAAQHKSVLSLEGAKVEITGTSSRLRASVHFDRYGYGLWMKNSLQGLYILLDITPK